MEVGAWEDAVVQAVKGATFDAPKTPCVQEMRLRFQMARAAVPNDER